MTTGTDTGIEVRALDGATKRLAPDVLATFRAAFRGPLLRPGEAGYDDARQIWNAMIDLPAHQARVRGLSQTSAAKDTNR